MREMLWSQADIARRIGITRQAIQARYSRGSLPEPEYETSTGAPLWTEAQATAIIEVIESEYERR